MVGGTGHRLASAPALAPIIHVSELPQIDTKLLKIETEPPHVEIKPPQIETKVLKIETHSG